MLKDCYKTINLLSRLGLPGIQTVQEEGRFDKALETDARYVMAYNNRGIAKIFNGAEQNFTRSVALRPSVKTFTDTRTAEIKP